MGVCWLALAAVVGGSPGCSSEPSHPPALGDCIPVADASCGPPPGGGGTGGSPNGDAAAEEDAEGGIFDAASCSSVASTYFQPANPQCLPQIEATCCMGLLQCATNNRDCQTLLLCAQEPCDAGSAASCLANCENNGNYTQAVVMAYYQLAQCIFLNCPACTPLPLQPSQSDL